MKTWTDADTAASYPDTLLEAAYRDLSKQNLRNQQDNETRWKADRLKALSAERRKRKALKSYAP